MQNDPKIYNDTNFYFKMTAYAVDYTFELHLTSSQFARKFFNLCRSKTIRL